MQLLSRTRLPYALIGLGFLAPTCVAVIYSVGASGAPRTIPPAWLMVARFGLPLCVFGALVGVVLAWRGGAPAGIGRRAFLLLLGLMAGILLAVWAMMFV